MHQGGIGGATKKWTDLEKSKELDNGMLWDVGKGNINLILRALACAKLGG